MLVVEDDDMVRKHVVALLNSLGFTVSEASDAPTGLQIIRDCPDIALLFTDIVMPGKMSGLDLAEAAEQLRPDLRILFTSGYRESDFFGGDRLDREVNLLHKPYRRDDLARQLRKVLDS